MRKVICGILTVLGLVLAYSAIAEAASYIFVTPLAYAYGQEVFCVATNFDTHAVTVEITLYDQTPNPVTPLDIDTCGSSPNNVAIGATCAKGTSNATTAGILCRIKSSSKHVHGAIEVRDLSSSHLVLMFPAALY
jgi:hypothetical protein